MNTSEFKALVTQAMTVRDAVVFAGGMATKSFMEDYLMLKHPGLSRHDAHLVTNHIEYENKEVRYETPPALADFPEVCLGKTRIKRASVKSS